MGDENMASGPETDLLCVSKAQPTGLDPDLGGQRLGLYGRCPLLLAPSLRSWGPQGDGGVPCDPYGMRPLSPWRLLEFGGHQEEAGKNAELRFRLSPGWVAGVASVTPFLLLILTRGPQEQPEVGKHLGTPPLPQEAGPVWDL